MNSPSLVELSAAFLTVRTYIGAALASGGAQGLLASFISKRRP